MIYTHIPSVPRNLSCVPSAVADRHKMKTTDRHANRWLRSDHYMTVCGHKNYFSYSNLRDKRRKSVVTEMSVVDTDV